MSKAPSPIAVVFQDGAPEALEGLAAEYPDEVTVVRAAGFNAADPGVVEAIIVGTPAVLASTLRVVRAHIESRRHVSVKIDGVEVTGMSGKDAVQVIKELSDRGGA